MGEEISKLCRCLPKSSITDDIYIAPEIKLLADYYSPHITDKEKEAILKAELKRLKLIRKSRRFNASSSGSNSNSNHSMANNHPFPSFLANEEEKKDMDANMSLNAESLESYSMNAPSNFDQLYGNIPINLQQIVSEDNITYANMHSHQNEGQNDTPLVIDAYPDDMQFLSSLRRSKSSPVLSLSPRASVSPVMDDAIWKLLDSNPGAMFTPAASERLETFGMPPTQPMIIPGLSSDSIIGIRSLLSNASNKNDVSYNITSSMIISSSVYIEEYESEHKMMKSTNDTTLTLNLSSFDSTPKVSDVKDNNTANEMDEKKSEVKLLFVDENVCILCANVCITHTKVI